MASALAVICLSVFIVMEVVRTECHQDAAHRTDDVVPLHPILCLTEDRVASL